MEKFWVLLMVQAMSEDEAVEAAVVNVKPDIRTPLNKPFLYAKGVYPVEVLVKDKDRIRRWGNMFKGETGPALLAAFDIGKVV